MKNLRKYLAVLIVITMVITTLVPALAEPAASFQYSNEAQKLSNLDLINGISTSTFDPALDLIADRETGVVLALRILGLEGTAISNYTDDAAVNNDLANCADANFISEWAKKQIAYAVKIGMIKGERIAENGQFYFNAKGPLIGNAFATMLLRSLGYEEGAFNYDGALDYLIGISSSANKISNASNWANISLTRDQLVGLSYYLVLAAKFESVAGEPVTTVIQNLLDKNKVTWDQIQSIGLANDLDIVATEPITISSVTATIENSYNKLTVVFSQDIGPTPVANDFKVTRSTQGIPSLIQDEVTEVSYDSGLKTAVLKVTPITPENDDQIITYSVMYKDRTPVNANLINDLRVSLVSATNLKQVNVVFNREVDKITAETVDNYSIAEIIIDSAVLQADNKTVVLNLNSDTILSQDTNYTVTINNVKNSDLSKTIDNDTVQEFKAQDNENPTVKSVEVLDAKVVRVVFSEPIRTVNAEAFSFSGEAGTIVSSLTHNAGTDDWTTVILELDSALAGGTHALSIAGDYIKDFADNYLEGVDIPFTVLHVISANTPTTTRIVVEFNKAVDMATATNPTNYTLLDEIGETIDLSSSTLELNDSNQIVTIDLLSQLLAKSYTLTISGIKDASSIEMLQEQTIDLKTPAKMLGTALVDSTHIDLLFNLPVKANNVNLQESIIVSQGELSSIGFKLVDIEGNEIDSVTARTIHLKLNNSVDIAGSVNVKTSSVIDVRDENNNFIEVNTTGFEAAKEFKAISITAPIQTIDDIISEKLVITFNKNIDLTTIQQSWADSGEAQNITLIFNENGELTIEGAMPGETIYLGVIKGFRRTNLDNTDIQPVLISDGLNTITIAITRQAVGEAIFAIGDNGLIYSPDAQLKSADEIAINPNYQPILEIQSTNQTN